MGVLSGGKGEDRFAPLGLAELGKVKVNEGGLEATVAKVGGDLADVCTAFEEVRGVAVTQGVDDELFVLFGKSAFDLADFEGGPNAGVAHGFATVVKGLFDRDAGAFPAASGGGEEPVRVAMPLPEGAQAGEKLGGDGDVALMAAFGMFAGDADGEGLAVDVGGADVEGFVKPQAAMVYGGEEGAVAAIAKGAEELLNFLAGEDVRKRFFALDFDLGPDLPFAVEVVAVEGADGTDGLVYGGGSEFALALEVG